MTITVGGSSITFPDATTQSTAGQPGTVTSVATGNGLSGGTITTTGTLVVACPTHNTVGSYVTAGTVGTGTPTASFTFGSNYAAGSGQANMKAAVIRDDSAQGGSVCAMYFTNSLSGTWKWMANTIVYRDQYYQYNYPICGIACRVS